MAKKSKYKISNYLKRNNVKRFIVFIIISFAFLLISKFSSDYKQKIILSPILENVDDEIILKDKTPINIEVRVEAKGFTLIPFIFDNKKDLRIDVNKHVKIQDSVYVFNIAEHRDLIDEALNSSYRILQIQPQSIEIPFAKLASKKVPVIFSHKINYASGFDIDGKFQLSDDSVKIVGAEPKIKDIKNVFSDTLKLKNVKDSIDTSVNINTSTLDDIEVFPKDITVRAKISRFTEGTIEVPVTIVNQQVGEDINYFPKSVSISYYINLEKFKTIKPSDFKVECDYSKVKDGQTFLIPELTKQPESVKRANIKPKRIDFIRL